MVSVTTDSGVKSWRFTDDHCNSSPLPSRITSIESDGQDGRVGLERLSPSSPSMTKPILDRKSDLLLPQPSRRRKAKRVMLITCRSAV